MARQGVTEQEIWEAATALSADGVNPTVKSVREKMGNRGSDSTIAPALKKWKIHRATFGKSLDKSAMPNEIITAVNAVWNTMQSKSQEEIKTANTFAQNTIADLQEHLAVEQQTNVELEAEIKKLTENLTSAQSEIESLKQFKEESTRTIEKQLVEINGLNQRIEDLKHTSNKAEQRVDTLQDEIIALNKDKAKLEASLGL